MSNRSYDVIVIENGSPDFFAGVFEAEIYECQCNDASDFHEEDLLVLEVSSFAFLLVHNERFLTFDFVLAVFPAAGAKLRPHKPGKQIFGPVKSLSMKV